MCSYSGLFSCVLIDGVGGISDSEALKPLNFHRLVKPVVESKCAACHKEKGKGPDMSYKSLQP
jgi:hypothetical protein